MDARLVGCSAFPKLICLADYSTNLFCFWDVCTSVPNGEGFKEGFGLLGHFGFALIPVVDFAAVGADNFEAKYFCATNDEIIDIR